MKKKIGISSKCLDGKHILMMDFDLSEGENKKKLQAEIMVKIIDIIGKYGLPDFYVFETKHGFHVVCMAKMMLKTVLKAYNDFKPLADKHHIRIGGGVCKRFILRIGGEIKPVAVVSGSNFFLWATSKAHQEFFSHFYDAPMRDQNPDESGIVVFELWE